MHRPQWTTFAVVLATIPLNFWLFSEGVVHQTPLTLCLLAFAIVLGFAIGPMMVRIEDVFGRKLGWLVQFTAVCFAASFLAEWLAGSLNFGLASMIYFNTPDHRILMAIAFPVLMLIALPAFASELNFARMALFSAKLAAVLLAAALVRLVSFLPLGSAGSSINWDWKLEQLAWRWAVVIGHLGPLSLLAALLRPSTFKFREATKAAFYGLALPLCFMLLLTKTITELVDGTELYRPSLEPNILMAWWGGMSWQFGRWYVVIAIISVLGVMRVAAKASWTMMDKNLPSRRWAIASYCLFLAASWAIGVQQHYNGLPALYAAMIAISSTMTAAAVAKPRTKVPATLGLLAGILAGLFTPPPGKYFAAYAAAMPVTLAGAAINRYFTGTQMSNADSSVSPTYRSS